MQLTNFQGHWEKRGHDLVEYCHAIYPLGYPVTLCPSMILQRAVGCFKPQECEIPDFTFPYFYNYPPYFTLQPVKDTREQIQLWKELILKYCKHQKCFLIDLDEEFPLFENSSIHRKLTFEAREQFLGALIADVIM